jgi:hypothetical protein
VPPPSIDPAVVAQIDAVVAGVPPIRGLQPKRPVPYRFITPEQFAEQFQQEFDTNNPVDVLAAEQALDKRLGLLPPDVDLRQLALSLYGSQVLAFYDPQVEQFTVIQRGAEFAASDRITVAHEYDHALQDQYWDLEALQVTDPTEGDRSLAFTALAEGDATALMYQWAFANLSPDEVLGLGGSVPPEQQQLLDSMPLLLRRTLLFPYTTGFLFALDRLGPTGSDWASVNATWDAPPVSTEQVMHPEKYRAGEAPVAIDLPNLAATLGFGWTTATTETLGEFVTGIWLADGQDSGSDVLGMPAPLPNADAAAGWAGDRLVSLEGPNGAWAVVWQTAWDSGADAQEFSSAASAVMSDLPGVNAVLGTSIAGAVGEPVLVLIGSDQATLDELRASLPGGG